MPLKVIGATVEAEKRKLIKPGQLIVDEKKAHKAAMAARNKAVQELEEELASARDNLPDDDDDFSQKDVVRAAAVFQRLVDDPELLELMEGVHDSLEERAKNLGANLSNVESGLKTYNGLRKKYDEATEENGDASLAGAMDAEV